MPTLSASTVESLRRTAFSVAYRVLGNSADAEDMAHDAVTRMIMADVRPDQPDAYVATIAVRLSLNHVRNARARRERLEREDLPVPLVVDQSAVDARIDLSYGLMVLAMAVPPLARAVFILRNAFDLSFAEIAAALDRSPAACRQAHSRAARHLADARPTEVSDSAYATVARVADLVGEGDVAGLTRLLARDIVLRSDGGGEAPAFGRPIHGRDRIAQFLAVSPRLVDATATVRVARSVQGPILLVEVAGTPVVAIPVDLADGRVTALYGVSNPRKLRAMARTMESNARL